MHAVVDSKKRPIFEGTADEVRQWLRQNEWALMFDVRVGNSDHTTPATKFMGRR